MVSCIPNFVSVTLNLFNILYPAIVAAAVIIGSALPGLIIIQSSKEAAILRVIGTTRRRTIAILMLEQVFLCIAGLIAGFFGLFLCNGASFFEISGKMDFLVQLYVAGCLVGTLICSVMVTQRNVL